MTGVLQVPPPSLLLFTNTSQSAWGAHLQDFTPVGTLTSQEKDFHISFLQI